VDRNVSEKQAWLARTLPLKWVLVVVIALIIVMAAIVATVLLIDRSRDDDRRAAADAATSTTGITSPYDLAELPLDADLDVVEKAAFVSIFVPNDSGTLTSYGVSADLPAARSLIEAIKGADKVDPDGALSELGGKAAESSLTFVLPTRETVSFALYLEQGVVARGADVWQPDGDVKALIDAAIAGPE
jgi:hypothetical protein